MVISKTDSFSVLLIDMLLLREEQLLVAGLLIVIGGKTVIQKIQNFTLLDKKSFKATALSF